MSHGADAYIVRAGKIVGQAIYYAVHDEADNPVPADGSDADEPPII